MQSNIWKDKKEKLGRKSLNFGGVGHVHKLSAAASKKVIGMTLR